MKNRQLIYKMSATAFFIAIICLFSFTPIGYIRLPGLSITLLVLPVSIGAILLGPLCGTILGLTFGITSFIQCFLGDPVGTLILAENPFLTFITCVLSRTMMGLLTGLIYKGMKKITDNKTGIFHVLPHVVANFSAAFLNTLFFMSLLISCFYGTIKEYAETNGSNIIIFIFVTSIGINWVVETLVNLIVGSAATIALEKLTIRLID